jgi:hypothetical protein
MVRRGSVGSVSACCKAGPSSISGRCFPSEQTSDEEMKRGLSKWRWINVLYEFDRMNECMLPGQVAEKEDADKDYECPRLGNVPLALPASVARSWHGFSAFYAFLK